jgi:ADP-ribosylglycohydrolase
MKKFILLFVVALGCSGPKQSNPSASTLKLQLTKTELLNKIKGGWAGQVIGVTYGGPTEFRYNGTMINDYVPIEWYDGYIRKTMTENAGLYDDLYMDLTFVDVFEKQGLNAPASAHASAYSNAGYMLWHANQAGRYNILNGMQPPQSGHWLNNPHADDIDFQIEADFAGLMSPGMPNTAAVLGDSIGHIMNFGDGWYGGVYVSAMYSLTFVSDDVNFVVKEALKMIPEQSTFYQCINDVIQWHQKYPTDWKQNWFEIQREWSDEIGCPDGVFAPFNIDAKMNAAYIVLGLLYGQGDFSKTMEVSVHAGQDSDCNPSSAGGILGALLGYDKIPPYWKQGLTDAEDLDFKYTTMSLNDVYQLSLKHALLVIQQNGGKVEDDKIILPEQKPSAVRLEQAFPDLFPTSRIEVHKDISKGYQFSFEGIGFVVRGEAKPKNGSSWDYTGDFAFKALVSIDGNKHEKITLPARFTTRRHEITWAYQLPAGKHTVEIKVANSSTDFELWSSNILIYQ